MQKIASSLLLLFSVAISSAAASTAIELDLTNQRAYLIKRGEVVASSPICSGRATHPTPRGTFRVTQKSRDHRSSLYGMVIDANGHVVKADADSDTPVPKGGKFVRAPMRHFLRFNGAVGMHAGILPGYPASHGCVRLPARRAAMFYRAASIGTPVRVYGRAPYRGTAASHSERRGSKRPTAPIYRRIPYLFQVF